VLANFLLPYNYFSRFSIEKLNAKQFLKQIRKEIELTFFLVNKIRKEIEFTISNLVDLTSITRFLEGARGMRSPVESIIENKI
jgi:hypothetical protein